MTRYVIQIIRHGREKQRDELNKEGREQLFEQAIVVSHSIYYTNPSRKLKLQS